MVEKQDPQVLAREIFGNAIDIDDLDARNLFVEQSCDGNQDLFEKVQLLLNAHKNAGGVLGETIDVTNPKEREAEAQNFLEDSTIVPSPSNSIKRGTMIGPYKLLQQIGEGGMGTVWMAEQEKPVRRRVAVKIIRGDMGDRDIIARFEAERQALAIMDHQNIARVYDAGTTETGSPWFAMELVKGIPITKYCDDNELSIRERLELMVPVCEAVQHAHHKGIVHRDLKPSNVLVSLYDGRAVPKVIDFGLAKAMEHQVRLTDKTLFTEFGKVVGTLQYMSPEQAEMNALDVDTRTDVYSLGILLYELLTGSTPIDKNTLKEKAILQVLALIRETEPPRPSTRLTQSANTIEGISKQRKISAPRLSEILRGELDWIVMRALEKDRTRRYETANGLAMDIQRFLDGDVVVARPPTSAYRIRKFVRKNIILVSGLFSIALILLIGVASTSWFALLANKHANESDRIASEKTKLADENNRIAKNERALRIRETDLSNKLRDQSLLATEQKCKALLDIGIYLFDEGRQDEGSKLVCQAFDELPLEHHLRDSYLRILESRVTRQGMWTKPALNHAGSVYQAVYLEDDKFLITRGYIRTDEGSAKLVCRVWDPATGKHIGDITDPNLNCEICIPDERSKTILLVLENGQIERWDYRTLARKTIVMKWKEPLRFTRAKLSPNGRVLILERQEADYDPTLVIIDLETKHVFQKQFDYPYFDDFEFTSDSSKILVGFENQITAINVVDGAIESVCTGQLSSAFGGGADGQYTELEHNAKGILAGINSGYQLDVWDIGDRGTPVGSVPSKARLTSVKFSPNGSTLALGSSNGIVQLFDATTLRKSGELVAFSPVDSIQFFPDGRWLAVQTADDMVRFFELQNGNEILHPIEHEKMFGFTISKAGNQVATFSDQFTLPRLWDIGSTVRGIKPFKVAIVHDIQDGWRVTISPDRMHYALTKCENGECLIKIKRTSTDEIVADWKFQTDEVNFDVLPKFSSTDSILLFVIDKELIVLNFSYNTKVGRFNINSDCDAIDFLPGSNSLIASLNPGLGVIKINNLENISFDVIENSKSYAGKRAISALQQLVYLDVDNKAKIFDFSTNESEFPSLPPAIFKDEIKGCHFHPFKSDSLVVKLPRKIVVTKLGESEAFLSTKPFPWEIKEFAFSATGNALAILYVDNTIQLFDGETLELTATENYGTFARSIRFWPNDKSLVVETTNETFVVDLPTMKLIGKLCENEVLCSGSVVSLSPGHALADFTDRPRQHIDHTSTDLEEQNDLLLSADGLPYFVSPDRFHAHIFVQDSKKLGARFRDLGRDIVFKPEYSNYLVEVAKSEKHQLHQNLGLRSRFQPNSEKSIQGGQLLTISVGLDPDWFATRHHMQLARDNGLESVQIDSVLLQSQFGVGDYEGGVATLKENYSKTGITAYFSRDMKFALSLLNRRLLAAVAGTKKTQAVNVGQLSSCLETLLDFADESTIELLPKAKNSYRYTIGVANYRLSDFEKSIEYLSNPKVPNDTGAPLSPAYSSFLAMSYLKLGKTDEAKRFRRLFDEAIKLDQFKDDVEIKSFAKELETAFAEVGSEKKDDDKD